jgi:hypothetical protein
MDETYARQYQRYYPSYYAYKTSGNVRQYTPAVVQPQAAQASPASSRRRMLVAGAIAVVFVAAAAWLLTMGEPKLAPELGEKVAREPDRTYTVGVYIGDGAPADLQGHFKSMGAKYIGDRVNASIVLVELSGRDVAALADEGWVLRIVEP